MKHTMTTTTLSLLALLLVPACANESEQAGSTEQAAQAVDTSLPGDPEAGKEIYGRICVACHAQDGKGNGGITGGNFVDDKARLAKSNEELLSIIRDGRLDVAPPMPAQSGVLSEQEMKDALAYIRYEFGGTRE